MQLNSHFRIQLLEALMDRLYRRSVNILDRKRFGITEKNSHLHNNVQVCFRFQGVTHTFHSIRDKHPAKINSLDMSLRKDMRELLEEYKVLDREKNVVRGYFQSVMLCSDREGDYRNLLPAALHEVLYKFRRGFMFGEDRLSANQVQSFLTNNREYVNKVKMRLAYNLIEMT